MAISQRPTIETLTAETVLFMLTELVERPQVVKLKFNQEWLKIDHIADKPLIYRMFPAGRKVFIFAGGHQLEFELDEDITIKY